MANSEKGPCYFPIGIANWKHQNSICLFRVQWQEQEMLEFSSKLQEVAEMQWKLW